MNKICISMKKHVRELLLLCYLTIGLNYTEIITAVLEEKVLIVFFRHRMIETNSPTTETKK